jgi:hypothetical protein
MVAIGMEVDVYYDQVADGVVPMCRLVKRTAEQKMRVAGVGEMMEGCENDFDEGLC